MLATTPYRMLILLDPIDVWFRAISLQEGLREPPHKSFSVETSLENKGVHSSLLNLLIMPVQWQHHLGICYMLKKMPPSEGSTHSKRHEDRRAGSHAGKGGRGS